MKKMIVAISAIGAIIGITIMSLICIEE